MGAPKHDCSTQAKTRILLVDDHPLMRQGMAEVLQRDPQFAVCGEAEDRHGALEAIAAAQPDLALVDLALKGSDGLELIKDIHARFPKVLILVVSMHDEMLHAERAIRAGASGYLTKEEAPEQVLEAARQVLKGETYVSQRVASQLAGKLCGRPRAQSVPGIETLTDRELQVFTLIGEGLDRNEVAERLHLDVNTIETYRARMKEKLQLKDAHELLQYAIRANREQHLGD
jgi:DNA-binding NarL/FixJ family response regulator